MAGTIILFIIIISLYIYKNNIKDEDIYIKNDINILKTNSSISLKNIDEKEKHESMMRMANNMCISIKDVKEDFLTELEANNISAEFIEEILQKMEAEKIRESEIFGIKPENTAVAMMIEWFAEYYHIEHSKNEMANSYFLNKNNTFVNNKITTDKLRYDDIFDGDSIALDILIDIEKLRFETKTKSLRMRLEVDMEQKVLEICSNDPIFDSPLGAYSIIEALTSVSKIFTQVCIEAKEELKLDEDEIISLIDDIKKNIYKKMVI